MCKNVMPVDGFAQRWKSVFFTTNLMNLERAIDFILVGFFINREVSNVVQKKMGIEKLQNVAKWEICKQQSES